MKKVLVLIFVILYPAVLWSHPGGTDKQGGHACWRNCSEWELKKGEYHFHDEQGNPIRATSKRSPQYTLPSMSTEIQDIHPSDKAQSQAAVPAGNHAQAPLPQATTEETLASCCTAVFPHSLALLLIALLLLLLLIRIHHRKSSR